jgi:hypothetical protein
VLGIVEGELGNRTFSSQKNRSDSGGVDQQSLPISNATMTTERVEDHPKVQIFICSVSTYIVPGDRGKGFNISKTIRKPPLPLLGCKIFYGK